MNGLAIFEVPEGAEERTVEDVSAGSITVRPQHVEDNIPSSLSDESEFVGVGSRERQFQDAGEWGHGWHLQLRAREVQLTAWT